MGAAAPLEKLTDSGEMGLIRRLAEYPRIIEAAAEAWTRHSSLKDEGSWAKIAVISGIAFVVGVFFYYVAAPWNLIGRTDPVGGEAGYQQVAARAREQLQKTGATWIATTDYRTYAMLRWELKDRVPVIEINERARFIGFKDPGMDRIRGRTGLYVVRQSDVDNPLWALTSAQREPLLNVVRSWRGIAMETYVLGRLTGWTPELSPPPDTPFYRWHLLADVGVNAR